MYCYTIQLNKLKEQYSKNYLLTNELFTVFLSLGAQILMTSLQPEKI